MCSSMVSFLAVGKELLYFRFRSYCERVAAKSAAPTPSKVRTHCFVGALFSFTFLLGQLGSEHVYADPMKLTKQVDGLRSLFLQIERV